MKIFEDFIIELMKSNVINQCVAKKEDVREIYNKQFRGKTDRPFSQFFRQLWRHWYVAEYSSTHITFDESWTKYIGHLKRAQNSLSERPFDERTILNKDHCQLCLVKFSNETQYKRHSPSLKHQIRIKYLTDRDDFLRNQDMFLKIIEVNNITDNKGLSMKFKQKTSVNATLHLISAGRKDVTIVQILQINPFVTELSVRADYEKGVTRLKSGEHLAIKIRGYFENSASFIYPIAIVAKYVNKKEMDYFLKEIKIEVTSEFSDLKSGESYKKVEKVKNIESYEFIIPGKPPDAYPSHYDEKFELKAFEVPTLLDLKLQGLTKEFPGFIDRSPDNYIDKDVRRIFANYLGINLDVSESEYYDFLLTLAHVEENQMKVDIRDYDMISSFIARGARYELMVPGLAEARPSLMVYDSVYVKNEKCARSKYQGIVHEVLENSVILGFNKKFTDLLYERNKKFYVEFGYNRRPIKVEKQALQLASDHKIVSHFFPKEEPKYVKGQHNQDMNYFNRILNEEQKRAVRNILEPKSVPYLIFGPPGTGKTVTIVEAILQIWKNVPNSRILVCAPSNAATNEIAMRLVDRIPSTDIFRFIGNLYGTEAKLEKLLNITNINKQSGAFYMPSMEDVLKYKVVLATLVTAARIVNGGVPDGHYSHVFIDESSYATESQSLIPIAGILSNSRNKGKVVGQVILAGDPQQLGPVVHSKFAEDCGYGNSMLERLINTCDLYARDESNPIPYNEKYVTKLVKNYRSHKSILKTPNELFYHNELIPAGNELSDLFAEWEHLRTPGFPMIFHHIIGEDRREKNSPSFFNIQEVEEVVEYISKLLASRVRGIQITEDHIGVISPYKKQVEMLRKACKRKQWDKILVGSVEQFQGKEKLIILLSTVRSKNVNKFEEVDKKCQLGFVRNPKRFNVAITRAKALLIIVGNALVLKNDKNWLSLIQYCVDNKSVGGRAFYLADNEYKNEEIP